jgi:hypothetical protein
MLTVQVPMDHIALFGFTFVFIFSLYKLSDTFSRPLDLFANVLLLVGLASLMTFHYKKITTGADVDTDPTQKQVRIVAHTCITAFFIITLAPMSKAVFRFYDNFALVAHAFLVYAVMTGQSQLLGVGLLALYFIFATYRKVQVSGFNMESLNMVGRLLLLIYFCIAFGTGLVNTRLVNTM